MASIKIARKRSNLNVVRSYDILKQRGNLKEYYENERKKELFNEDQKSI